MVTPAIEVDPLVVGPDGSRFLNPELLTYEQDWLFADGTTAAGLATNSPIVGANAGQDMQFTPQLIKGDQGDFEGAVLCSTSTGRFSCRLYDNFLERYYSNQPVPNDLMFGAIEYPGWLAESTFVPASVSLTATVVDLSTGANTITLMVAGRRLMGCGVPRASVWQAYKNKRSHPYWLTFDLGAEQTVLAAAVTTFTMTVPAGVTFLAKYLLDDTSRTIADGTTVMAEYNVRVFNGNNGESLIGARNQATVPISLVAAKSRTVTGVQGNKLRAVGNPFKLPYNHLFQEKTQVTVEVTNNNAFSIVVRLAWHGIALYADRCQGGDPRRMLDAPVGIMPAPSGYSCSPPTCGPGGQALEQPSYLQPMQAAQQQNRSPYAVSAPAGYVQPASIAPAQASVQQGPALNPWSGAGWAAGWGR